MKEPANAGIRDPNELADLEVFKYGVPLSISIWPSSRPLTATSLAGVKTWDELLQEQAKRGVKIRIIMSDFDPVAAFLRDRVYTQFLSALNKIIDGLTPATRDNFKYIVSRHPATHFTIHVGTHHQKWLL